MKKYDTVLVTFNFFPQTRNMIIYIRQYFFKKLCRRYRLIFFHLEKQKSLK